MNAKKENPYKNIDWHKMMGNGEEKTIGGVDYIIFSDNSALKTKETWIDGELDDVEWVLASPTRIDKTSGKSVYDAETFEAQGDCEECYGTGGLYDSHMGINDECHSCGGTGFDY